MEQRDFEARGMEFARSLGVDGDGGARLLCHRIEQALEQLEQKRTSLSPESGASEWLLDNGYLARQEGHGAISQLRGAKRLRICQGTPMVYRLCEGYFEESGGALDAEGLEQFLTGFQRLHPLRYAERAAVLPCLKAAAILSLSELYAQEDPEAEEAGKRFSALRILGALAFSQLLERADPIEAKLSKDPAGVYSKMDETTRTQYRKQLAKYAKSHQMEEAEAADALLKKSHAAAGERRHIGWQLYHAEGSKTPGGGWYLTALVLLTLFSAVLFGFLTSSLSCAILLILPISEVVKQIMDSVLLRLTPPRPVPRMELKHGVPKAGKTLCVVSALLAKPEDAEKLARRLEDFALCSRDCGEHLKFGILADFPEADSRTLETDEQNLETARSAIEHLNEIDPQRRFYLFTRPRGYVRGDGIWRGWERKRGALMELAGLLRGRKTALLCAAGDREALQDTQFLLTLDTDTILTPGAARSLIGAMLHPLNAPVIDKKRGVVTAGYGLLHPRIATDLKSAVATDFTRILAGAGGMDVYGLAGGELFMDRYDCGGFAGKGILSIDALLTCCGKSIPENRVLSHDALEGACLRGGFVGDTELLDGFPQTPLSFWARQERWTRGDWQNLPWLFRRGKAFRTADRIRLLDSLRRSLVPPMTLLAILAGLWRPWPGLRLAAWTALLALLSDLILSLRGVLLRREPRVHTFSGVLQGTVPALLQTVLRLIFLPMEAWICASAMIRSLWRMLISHRRLLQWQTAAQSEGVKRGKLPAWYRAMLPAAILGAVSLLVSPVTIGKAAGALWLLSPILAMLLSKPNPPVQPLHEKDKTYLRNCAREIWHWFETFCTEEDHFLPPDNWQEQPPAGTAHRTSPTNMGLGLVSALSAAKLGIDEEKGLPLAERMLTTMEALPKWRGHFYNWYQTITKKPLRPAYVSTVDSGNLCASLIAAKAAFLEFGRADLAERAGRLAEQMDFRMLYDEARCLFRIGVNTDDGSFSPGWYDLFSGEARLTGYLAVARGEAPVRHWRSLSRAQTSLHGYRGTVSWTGTMFEYLMPELFLPLQRESLNWESAKFCLHAQKSRVLPGRAWGISESGFYSLDPALHYRYKAHGVGALALRRDMDQELVLSPYSSFLALLVEPRSAVRNLRRLERMGLRGPYGFYEAMDLTPGRCRGSSGEIVKSCMAHHLGMSMAAITNALLDGQVQRWAMAEPALRAHGCLLSERVPTGGPVLKRERKQVLKSATKQPALRYLREGDGVDPLHGARCLLSNGRLHLRFPESGGMALQYEGAELFFEPPRFRLSDETLFPIRGGEKAHWKFTDRYAELSTETARLTAAVSASEAGCLWVLELRSAAPVETELELTLSPALAEKRSLESHPAFWRLGIQEQHRGNARLWRRLERSDAPERWMCLAGDGLPSEEGERWLTDGRSVITIPIRMEPEEIKTLRFAVAVGRKADDAFLAAQQTLAMPEASFSDLPARLARQLGLGAKGLQEAMALVSPLIDHTLPEAVSDPNLLKKDALWKNGISGDLPILAAPLTEPEHRRTAARLMREHALLHALGVKCDLVFCVSEAGDYQQPEARFVHAVLQRIDREDTLAIPGGVHLVSDTEAAKCNASIWLEGEYLPLNRNTASLPEKTDRRDRNSGPVRYTQRTDGSVLVQCGHTLPKRVWSLPLTNGHFGFTAADSGCGDLWLENARERRITPWRNDPWAVKGPETLYAIEAGEARSLFCDYASDGRFTCRLGCAQWETGGLRVTAFVPFEANVRVLMIESKTPVTLRWRLDLLLASETRDESAVITEYHDGVLSAVNPRAERPFTVFARCSVPFRRYTCSRERAMQNQFDGFIGTGVPGCFAAEFSLESRAVLVIGADAPELANWDNAVRALKRTLSSWQRFCGRLRCETAEAAFGQYLSGWGAYQAMACRLMARTSIYQSGGAFGFRDQLQDAVNLILWNPTPARRQILRCCAKQFPEGDVCHWWHESAGVRTRISDDLLWLPWAVLEYAEKTGDTAVLTESVPYLEAEPLRNGERERYLRLKTSKQSGTVLEHCIRAIQCVLRRGTGDHGLLKIGSGDWNDGFDRVEGESVWLSWFFSHTAHRMAALLEQLGLEGSEAMHLAAKQIGEAAERSWDGNWYRRGYFADGTPLGSSESAACQIDAIAQSFAVLSPEADPAHVRTALKSALDRLYDPTHHLLKLFDPPFTNAKPNPGYVRSYGPGFRENGGQYTHGAIWLAWALLMTGETEAGWQILRALLPARHRQEIYEAEPFVLAADVYAGDHPEQAGWSWYTGAAGWYLRTAAEGLFGLTAVNGQVTLRPNLPGSLLPASIRWRDGSGQTHWIEYRSDGFTVDGEPDTGGLIGKL